MPVCQLTTLFLQLFHERFSVTSPSLILNGPPTVFPSHASRYIIFEIGQTIIENRLLVLAKSWYGHQCKAPPVIAKCNTSHQGF